MITEERIEVNDLSIDIPCHEVTVGSKKVELTFIEFSLLTFLVRNQGRVLTRPTIISGVWGVDAKDISSRAVDTEICRLRKKIESGSVWPTRLISVRGIGYKFVR